MTCGTLRLELRNVKLLLLGHGLLVYLIQCQSKTLILAAVVAVQVLDEHRVVQLLLLKLQRKLLLLDPGIGLH